MLKHTVRHYDTLQKIARSKGGNVCIVSYDLFNDNYYCGLGNPPGCVLEMILAACDITKEDSTPVYDEITLFSSNSKDVLCSFLSEMPLSDPMGSRYLRKATKPSNEQIHTTAHYSDDPDECFSDDPDDNDNKPEQCIMPFSKLSQKITIKNTFQLTGNPFYFRLNKDLLPYLERMTGSLFNDETRQYQPVDKAIAIRSLVLIEDRYFMATSSEDWMNWNQNHQSLLEQRLNQIFSKINSSQTDIIFYTSHKAFETHFSWGNFCHPEISNAHYQNIPKLQAFSVPNLKIDIEHLELKPSKLPWNIDFDHLPQQEHLTSLYETLKKYPIRVVKSSDPTLDDYVGQENMKEDIYSLIPRNAYDERNTIGRGMILAGPGGVGKSFFAECFAGSLQKNDADWEVYHLKDTEVTSRFVSGSTEKIEHLLETFKKKKKLLIIWEEAEAYLSKATDENSTAANEYKKARGALLKLFDELIDLSEKRNHKYFWMLTTNNPDNMDGPFVRRLTGAGGKRVFLNLPDFNARTLLIERFLENRRKNKKNIQLSFMNKKMIQKVAQWTAGFSTDDLRPIPDKIAEYVDNVARQKGIAGENLDAINQLTISEEDIVSIVKKLERKNTKEDYHQLLERLERAGFQKEELKDVYAEDIKKVSMAL